MMARFQKVPCDSALLSAAFSMYAKQISCTISAVFDRNQKVVNLLLAGCG